MEIDDMYTENEQEEAQENVGIDHIYLFFFVCALCYL